MDVVFTHADRIIVLDRGRADRLRRARPRCAPTAGFRRSIWAAAPCSGIRRRHERCHSERRRAEQLLRAGAYPVRRDAGGRRGEVVALLGRNGAGKSTTLRSVMGLVADRSGRVSFAGHDIIGQAAARDRPAGPRLCPGGPADLHRPDRDGESGGRPPARRAAACAALDAGAAVHAVPQPGRHARPPRRADERRRAADADDRAHADGQPVSRSCWTSRRRVWRPGSRR